MSKIKIKTPIKRLLFVGASTGGPRTIVRIFSKIESINKETSVIIVQHMTPGFTKAFVKRLRSIVPFQVEEAKDEGYIIPQSIYIAPSEGHTKIEKNQKGYKTRIFPPHKVKAIYIPSIDFALKSIAENFEGEVLVVILTGMGGDGIEGLKALLKKNPKTRVIAQGEKTSIIFGMNKRIIEAGLSDKVLETDSIAEELKNWLL